MELPVNFAGDNQHVIKERCMPVFFRKPDVDYALISRKQRNGIGFV